VTASALVQALHGVCACPTSCTRAPRPHDIEITTQSNAATVQRSAGMASSSALLLRSARMHVVRRCAVAGRVCLSRAPPPSAAATRQQPNKARQGTSTRPATTTRRPSPLEYAKSQAVVTVRLYASLLTNPRNRYDAQALHALLDDWKVRCPHSSTKDVAIMMTAAAGAAARCGLPAVSTDLLERVPRGQFVPAGALRLVLQSSQYAQCASSARRSLQLIKQHSRLTIKDLCSACVPHGTSRRHRRGSRLWPCAGQLGHYSVRACGVGRW
jgi:hypothetical protein